MTLPRPLRLALARLAAASLVLAAAAPAQAVAPLVQHDIVLLQKGDLIEQRVDGGAEAMGAYLKTLGDAEVETMRSLPTQIPSAGFIVIAIRPGQQTRTWFDFKPALAEATMAALTRTVAATPTFTVRAGQVVFALRVSLWSDRPPAAWAPAPQEWKDAARGVSPKPDIDALVDRVWPR